jgi:hypothetical protein
VAFGDALNGLERFPGLRGIRHLGGSGPAGGHEVQAAGIGDVELVAGV